MILFLNMVTGESVERKSWCGAFVYFKSDSRKLKYKLRFKDVITLKKYLKML